MPYDPKFMQRALALSATSLDTPGTQPFGAVVVRNGEIVGEGLNHALARLDPTAHGEIEALRDACRRLGRLDLGDCELYTSCEPCALCVAALQMAGIRHLYYAAGLRACTALFEPLAATRWRNLDTDDLRVQSGLPGGARRLPDSQHEADAALHIIAVWVDARVAVP
ncbi:nucleoside deaminase [Plasticicumulans sp.]|uniref:nucleoside deaminase n=1 Tax=Plasticicumulans sp. TaxID=2307179 RepID=UPI003961EAE9